MTRFIWMGVVLQIAMVVAGHYNETILLLSGPLGVGIPFVLGLWYGATVPRDMKTAAKGGFIIGIVGAFIGVLVAIGLGDAQWFLLSFAPLSSAVTGLLGAIITLVATGRHKATA